MERIIDLYKTAFMKYADFEGRACRAEACAFYLTNFVVIFISYILFWILFFAAAVSSVGATVTYSTAQNAGPTVIALILSLLAILVGIFMFVFALITLVPSLSLGARRCHDFNASGWLQLLIIVGSFVFTIVIMCIPGTIGDNQYGKPSKKF